jgi:hypothetical protein
LHSHLNKEIANRSSLQTSGIPLEELDAVFGNKVAAHLSDIRPDDVESKGTHLGSESVQIEVAHTGIENEK